MRILFHADLNHGQAAAVWRCRDLLKSAYGIELMLPDNPDLPAGVDFALVHSLVEDWWKKLENGPVVCLERIDGAQLSAPVRKFIGHPNLRAVIKNTIYADWNFYNLTPWRWHENPIRASIAGHTTCQYDLLPANQLITPEQYAKLKLGFSFAAYPHMDSIRHPEPFELSQPRPYTCHFAGTTDYGAEMGWLNWHRQQALAATEKIDDPGAVCVAGRPLQFPEYFATMRQSEFVVSPWGLGEPCYRDFEAVLSGCMVIKPDTRHILTVPGQFYRIPSIERCICKPDFSDLPDIVANVGRVSIGDRIQWARHVAEQNSTPAIAGRLARIFKAAVK